MRCGRLDSCPDWLLPAEAVAFFGPLVSLVAGLRWVDVDMDTDGYSQGLHAEVELLLQTDWEYFAWKTALYKSCNAKQWPTTQAC